MGPASTVMGKSVSRIYTELVLAESKKKSRKNRPSVMRMDLVFARGAAFILLCSYENVRIVNLVSSMLIWID